ncbi:hypothetical protein ACHWQZ_G000540 [Mnemiopsis leidyi]
MTYRQSSYNTPSRRDSYSALNSTPSRRPSYTLSNYGSGSGSSSSRYGSTKSSGYGTTSSTYGSSSGYGGYSSSTAGSGYDSGYAPSRTPSYGSGLSSYGGSNYSSSYGSSNYSTGSGYGSSAFGRTTRDYDAVGSGGGGNANTAYSGSSAYTSRTARDRSSERSLENIYTPRNSRRSHSIDRTVSRKNGVSPHTPSSRDRSLENTARNNGPRRVSQSNAAIVTMTMQSKGRKDQVYPLRSRSSSDKLPPPTPGRTRSASGSTSDYFSRSGLRKSSSYSGLHWTRDTEKKEHKTVNVNDMIYKSHRRQGSNSSLNSDVFEDTKPGITRSRESSLRTKPAKRDLEAILGKEDHMLVQRIIEENKAIIEEAHSQLTSQEEKLIKKIMEVSMSGNSVDCLDILTIIESC